MKSTLKAAAVPTAIVGALLIGVFFGRVFALQDGALIQGGGAMPDLEPLAQAEPEQHSELRLNINTATEQQLDELPGIGPVLARAIIDYRTENGDFESTEELMSVSGIGRATYAEIENLIMVP